ncbi:MAG: YgiQ family radical SAM protein [Bacteroidota bacterium]
MNCKKKASGFSVICYTFGIQLKDLEELRPITDWLPVTREEMDRRGWKQADVIIVSGDAYVDHPSFGHAVIARIIEHEGFRVAILPQPNWRDDLRDFKKLGRPRLFFGVTAGCMDSMVNHYTAGLRLRSDDAYTAGDKSGFRPDYATYEYTRILKQIFPETPVIIGGVEASLRRFTHYDYWSDTLKPSVLAESKADMLIYGMGEQAIIQVVHALAGGSKIEELNNLPQTAFRISKAKKHCLHYAEETLELPSHEQCVKDKKAFAESFRIIETESNKMISARLIQDSDSFSIVVNPPLMPMNESTLDASFSLPYTRLPHPRYKKRGSIPAWEMIKFSVTIHRGCFGGCSFCTISAHQGRFIASRSEASIIHEIEEIKKIPGFTGNLTDLGGPSANMYRMKGTNINQCMKCKRPSCIYPANCPNLNDDHGPLTALYKRVQALQGIRKIFIGSGIRYDMITGKTAAENKKGNYSAYAKQVIAHHVSGRLKIAPEHSSDHVLKLMRKPSFKLFKEFTTEFEKISSQHGLRQQIVPYFISSHPGSTLADMAELAAQTKELGYRLEQVQDFTPTPMTLASVMFYTGIDPYTGEKVYSARTRDDKNDQKSFFFWYKKENSEKLRFLLNRINRPDIARKLLMKRQ